VIVLGEGETDLIKGNFIRANSGSKAMKLGETKKKGGGGGGRYSRGN